MLSYLNKLRLYNNNNRFLCVCGIIIKNSRPVIRTLMKAENFCQNVQLCLRLQVCSSLCYNYRKHSTFQLSPGELFSNSFPFSQGSPPSLATVVKLFDALSIFGKVPRMLFETWTSLFSFVQPLERFTRPVSIRIFQILFREF